MAPEAELFDGDGKRVGHHFASPRWEADDGSRIVGSVKARADAPQRGAIAWLRRLRVLHPLIGKPCNTP